MVKTRLKDIFTSLVQIDSPTGEEDEIINYLFQYIHSNKLANTVKKDSYGNLYVRVLGSDVSKEAIFFSAHVDTVEPGRGIVPKLVDGHFVSEGQTILGADNKASLAAQLELLWQFKEHIPPRTVEFVFTRSEEVGNYGAIHFDYNLLSSTVGFCFDSSQPVGTVITASPYYERFDIRIIGKSAHAARPEEARNILSPLQQVLSNIHVGKIDDQTICNIGVIQAGDVRNTIPGEVFLKGEIRSFSEAKLLFAKESIQNTLASISDYEIVADFVRENPGYDNRTHPAISNIREAVEASDLSFSAQESWGVSDANIFNEKGLTVFNMSDGSEFSHTSEERVSLESMRQMTSLMQNLVGLL